MVKVDVKYTGNLHCDATHGPSESKISTDAPTDNKGKGAAFSPTDLVATALATCMSTTMGIKAEDLGVDLRGMTVSVQKEMSKDAPRRIVGLPSEVHIPLPPDSPHREVLEQTALNCPVHKSLPPEIHRPTKFSKRDQPVFVRSFASLRMTSLLVCGQDCLPHATRTATACNRGPLLPAGSAARNRARCARSSDRL